MPCNAAISITFLPDGEIGIDVRLFRYHTEVPPHSSRLLEKVMAGDRYGACRGPNKSGKHSHGRALACAVGPEKTKHLTPVYREIDAVYRDGFARTLIT